MPNTYTLIASNTLGSSAASVTFSSIPNTYTDLVVKYSARGTASFTTLNMLITINSTAANYSTTRVYGNGASVASDRTSAAVDFTLDASVPAVLGTSNTFNNGEIYIPNYLVANNKPIGITTAEERNNTTATISGVAALWSNTSAVTAISFAINSGNYASGSSFFLYGIKNS